MSEVETVKVIIDGQELNVPKNQSIIQAADEAGIMIPRFCYHKKLSVAANCRMCLVDMKGGRKPMPACATPVSDGMEIYTKSKKAIEYQKAVMEFLLINHPLDCPICDQGGECELQDMAMGYGKDVSRYNQGKRTVKDHDIGPLIETDLTRCIQCTRCVRFGKEVAGIEELGMIGRGEHSEISTFLHKSVDSEMSGNAIDLCPVGALTSKPFRYQARAWEMQAKPGISPHDCVGSNLSLHARRNQVMRVVPAENEALNEVWISDRDRFSYEGLYSEERLKHPMIKRDGEWEKVSWSDAFEYMLKRFVAIKEDHGIEVFGALASPSSTTEELYLLQKFMRTFDCHNIDHRLKQQDFAHQGWETKQPGLDCSLADIEDAEAVWLLGSEVRSEHPIIHHRLRKASLKGHFIAVTNPLDARLRFEPNIHQILNVDDLMLSVAAVVKALVKADKKQTIVSADMQALLEEVETTPETDAIAKQLKAADQPIILVGAYIQHHPQASTTIALLQMLRQLVGAKGGLLTEGANTAGAWLTGAVPHRAAGGAATEKKGRTAKQMLTEAGIEAFILLNVEPELDANFGAEAHKILKAAQCVVALTPFFGKGIEDYADVVFPIATFAETSGTYINATGEQQRFQGAVQPVGEARPAWKVIRVMANFLEFPGFDYESTDAIWQACMAEVATAEFKPEIWKAPKVLPKPQRMLKRLERPMIYGSDMLVRRAESLQCTQLAEQQRQVYVSTAAAKKLRVAEGDTVVVQQNRGPEVKLKIFVDATLPDRNVLVPQGIAKLNHLGVPYDKISLEQEGKD